ncbi:DNA-binding transcriptional regulator, LysR family [Thermosyntropha lipolytica DSM 11003]|uniref:DNA-binding transcriptional regulator, LysR family n=1 Tax=Thermosyntropha lipolytica DSM 11003 TaxID=1123382 RepID=A0A1M5LBX0_9FIRM|nr:LysR family transcriptional regulator [Thermosyntropha lipolytica]SHG62531.1 DNA-binding transcriptional regulator, LysR family [Thermosyntropha lipolytica DSM 11003]
MNIEQFEIFRTIAQVKSFTRAAKILNFTQPAISSQIKSLEQYYNVELFERGSSGVKLTEAGKKFYEYGEKILALFNEMEAELAKISGSTKEFIKLGASNSPGNYFLPSAIKVFKARHPNAYVRVDIAHSYEIIEALRERSLDIGVIEGDMSYGPDIERHKISSNKLVLVAPANAKWKKIRNISIQDLMREPFIAREEEATLRYLFNSYLKSIGYNLDDMNIVMEITNWEAMKQAVLNNVGLAIIPYPVVEKEIKEGKLVEIALEGENLQLNWNIEVVVRSGETLTGLKKELFDFLTSPDTIWKAEEENITQNKMRFI